LPVEGEDETLYVQETTLYRWNSTTNEYDTIVGGAIWEDL
jgi:hypothetical protein